MIPKTSFQNCSFGRSHAKCALSLNGGRGTTTSTTTSSTKTQPRNSKQPIHHQPTTDNKQQPQPPHPQRQRQRQQQQQQQQPALAPARAPAAAKATATAVATATTAIGSSSYNRKGHSDNLSRLDVKERVRSILPKQIPSHLPVAFAQTCTKVD